MRSSGVDDRDGRAATRARCGIAIVLGLVCSVSCTPGIESVEQQSSALKTQHQANGAAAACCKRRHPAGAHRDRCMKDAQQGCGPCAGKPDAGGDAPVAADASFDADARADVHPGADAAPDALPGIDAVASVDAGAGADAGAPTCALGGAACGGNTLCCAGAFCDPTSSTCVCFRTDLGDVRCTPGELCCSGRACTKNGMCPTITCTPTEVLMCSPASGLRPLPCCSSMHCFPAPSSICPCLPDGFACNLCCAGAGCQEGTCQAAPPPDGGPEAHRHCPTARIRSGQPTVVPVAGAATMTAEVVDVDVVDTLTQTWSIVSGDATLSQPATAATVTVTCQAPGAVRLQLAADDGRGPAAIAAACPRAIVTADFACGPVTCEGGACDDSNPCCPGTACLDGQCAACGGDRATCDAVTPCCAGYACILGVCTSACMPVGGMCDATHPCCSGVPCQNNICGNLGGGTGSACDELHPCAFGDGCVDGICNITTCVPRDEPCLAGTCCLGAGVCAATGGFCRVPGCLGGCSTRPECCHGAGGLCAPGGGLCQRILSCIIPGFPCAGGDDCCSHLCLGGGTVALGTCL